MKMPKSLIIDPQFKNLIPPLQRTEYLQLEENLLADGCRDPLVVWRGTLVDGHNRYEICMRHRIPFSVTEVDFYCREEAIAWICANQLGRRNLSEGTRKYLIGKQYDSEKFVSKIKNPSGLNQYSLPVSPRPGKQDSPDTSRHRTADRIADENCISAGTVEKYAIYAAMEAELQDMLDNIESEYPGYDEYRVNADEIEHDPYVLISILSAWHEGVFTLDEVQSTLEMLFEKQYILTVEEEVQVRYRTETRTDSEGNPYTVEVPYNYYILHVDLENFNLSHVPVYIMGEEQLSMYAMYMSSLGNRPDLFPQSGYVSKYYENPPADYEVPAALLGSDEKFARLMEEADKYVGFPYVWGGSTPETSFDCSGFVSYVLTNSGLYNTGRLGAQGLYNISTPVSNPQPGDLVFFTGTYDTPGVSHVGIYVGEDGDGSPVMLHCGDPIQYSKLDTSYWQSHFYAYGRLNYN